jgi:hypothetical protein
LVSKKSDVFGDCCENEIDRLNDSKEGVK